jgi:uncharacterized protein (TIGR03435 family)
LKVSTTEANGLTAELHIIDQDQGGAVTPSAGISTSGNVLKLVVDPLNAAYEGRMSADGNTINGAWTQRGDAAPLNFTRATAETAWTIPEPPPPPKMMDPNAKPQFEVATIKPSDPAKAGFAIRLNPSGVNTLNTTLIDLLKFAYDMHAKQVIGAPAWADADKFDIVAKPDAPGMPNISQMKLMLQKLLADRFSLVFHKDRKELSVYAITVMDSGVKIRKEEHATTPLPGISGQPQRGFNVGNATLSEFASALQAQFMDLPVVDQTGFGDTRYTFVVRFTPDVWMRASGGAGDPANASDPEAPPDLFSAMERQLGLRLRKAKALAGVMVIDGVGKPSSN